MLCSSVLTPVCRENKNKAVVADTIANVKGAVDSGGVIHAFGGAFDCGGVVVHVFRRGRVPR